MGKLMHRDIPARALPNFLAQERSEGRPVFTVFGEPQHSRLIDASRWDYNGMVKVTATFTNDNDTVWTKVLDDADYLEVLPHAKHETDQAFRRLFEAVDVARRQGASYDRIDKIAELLGDVTDRLRIERAKR